MSLSLLENRYTLVRQVGAGAHGQVFEATDKYSGEHVAMKLIQRTAGGSIGLSEFSAVLAVDHPCIIRCLDFHYLGNGDTCLVYEFIPGGTLRERMVEGVPATEEVWNQVARDILSALAHLHSNQIIHSDLKPENILCQSLADNTTRYMVSDLGIARYDHTSPALASTASSSGSPAYMAPECFYQKITSASDLYSLGVILYELATGHRAFEGDIRSIARAHIQTTPDFDSIPDPHQCELVRWLLNKNPDARPHSADDALRSLVGIVSTDKIAISHSAPKKIPSTQYISDYKFHSEFFLNITDHQILPISLLGRPTIVVIYESHIELLDGATGRALNRFLPCSSGTLQFHPDGSILSAQPGRLVAWEGDFRLPRTIFDFVGKPRTALLNHSRSHVIWAENDSIFIRELNQRSGRVYSLACPSSGLRPRLLLPPTDASADFIVIPGNPCPEALWLDLEGNILARKLIPGPVVDSSHTQFPAVFCATPDEQPSAGLTLVVFGDCGKITLIPFDSTLRHSSYCEDGVIIRESNGSVNFIGADYKSSSLGRVEDPACNILFSPCRDFYFTIYESGTQLRIKLYILP